MAVLCCFQSEQSYSVPLLFLYYKQLLGITLLLSIVQSFFYAPYSKLNVMWLCIFLSFEIKWTQNIKRNWTKSATYFLVPDGKFGKQILLHPLQIGKLRHRCLFKGILVADRRKYLSLSACLIWQGTLDDIHVVFSSTKQLFHCSLR